MSWTSCASSDAVLLLMGDMYMSWTSYASSDAVNRTSASSNSVSSVIGERSSGKTKHVRYFCQDASITETIRHRDIPLHPSCRMDISLHDYAVIASTFLGSTQLRRIFLPWGAFSPNPFALQFIYVLLHDIVCCETTATSNGKFYAASTVDWGDEDMSSTDVYDHGTAWEAADVSFLPMLNTATASAVMVCTSPSYTIILPRRLLRLSTPLHSFEMVLFGRNNNTFDSGNVHCLFKWGTSFDGKDGTREDNETPESISSSAEFMPRIDMRSYYNIKRNDGGDTMHRHKSRLNELVTGADMTEIIGDDEMIPIAASGTNGEAYNLVDITPTIIAERMDISHKCIPLLEVTGELLLVYVIDQYWKENASTGDEEMLSAEHATQQGDNAKMPLLRGAADKSLFVSNMVAASTTTTCSSSPCTIITLLQHLLRLSAQMQLGNNSDSFANETSRHLSSSRYYASTTLDIGKHASSIKRPSCTLRINGERLLCGLDKTSYVNSFGSDFATISDHSLFEAYGNFTQQVMQRRHICADAMICTPIQQLMGSAYYSPQEHHYRSVITLVFCTSLHASIASINVPLNSFDVVNNATEAELLVFELRRDMLPDGYEDTSLDTSFGIESCTFKPRDHITASYHLNMSTLIERIKYNAYDDTLRRHTSMCGSGIRNGDILHERWDYSYAGLGLFFGLILFLRRVMGSHTLQTVDLGISISSRRGVTDWKLGCLILDLYTDSLPICKYTCTLW